MIGAAACETEYDDVYVRCEVMRTKSVLRMASSVFWWGLAAVSTGVVLILILLVVL